MHSTQQQHRTAKAHKGPIAPGLKCYGLFRNFLVPSEEYTTFVRQSEYKCSGQENIQRPSWGVVLPCDPTWSFRLLDQATTMTIDQWPPIWRKKKLKIDMNRKHYLELGYRKTLEFFKHQITLFAATNFANFCRSYSYNFGSAVKRDNLNKQSLLQNQRPMLVHNSFGGWGGTLSTHKKHHHNQLSTRKFYNFLVI
jgi:hypothetical protein